jgi:carboxylesterase type B
MSEDCVTLNVFTPAGQISRKKLLPVMVWLHGGAFQQGGADRPEYQGKALVDRDLIVVTVNYRLGALGFLVSSSDSLYGNYGLMDQRAALDWRVSWCFNDRITPHDGRCWNSISKSGDAILPTWLHFPNTDSG